MDHANAAVGTIGRNFFNAAMPKPTNTISSTACATANGGSFWVGGLSNMNPVTLVASVVIKHQAVMPNALRAQHAADNADAADDGNEADDDVKLRERGQRHPKNHDEAPMSAGSPAKITRFGAIRQRRYGNSLVDRGLAM